MTPVFLARDGNSGGIDGKVMSDQVAQEGTMFFHVLEELLFLLWVFMAMKKVSALICSSREGDVLGDHTVAIITGPEMANGKGEGRLVETCYVLMMATMLTHPPGATGDNFIPLASRVPGTSRGKAELSLR